MNRLSGAYVTLILALLILITGVTALACRKWYYRMVLHPSVVYSGKEFHRLISAGFVHADAKNLVINLVMLVIYSAGLESLLAAHETCGHLEIAGIFLAAILSSNVISARIHRSEFFYTSTGSSAGVLAIMITYLLFTPSQALVQIPLIGGISNWLVVPMYILSLLYLAIKRSRDRISHELHLFGAITGILLFTVLHPAFMLQLMSRSLCSTLIRPHSGYQSPAQFGPVAATAAPTSDPNPPKTPPTVALTAIDIRQFPESLPPSRLAISSVEYLFITKIFSDDHHWSTGQNSPEMGVSGNPGRFKLNLQVLG